MTRAASHVGYTEIAIVALGPPVVFGTHLTTEAGPENRLRGVSQCSVAEEEGRHRRKADWESGQCSWPVVENLDRRKGGCSRSRQEGWWKDFRRECAIGKRCTVGEEGFEGGLALGRAGEACPEG